MIDDHGTNSDEVLVEIAIAQRTRKGEMSVQTQNAQSVLLGCSVYYIFVT
jgi:hypothetical protein